MSPNAKETPAQATIRRMAAVPDHYRAVVAPYGKGPALRWAVVTHWLDPKDRGTAAELASYRSLRGAYVIDARAFRARHTWNEGAWRRVWCATSYGN